MKVIGVLTRLNRTSVGLKPLTHFIAHPAKKGPQSNQRGIETIIPHPTPPCKRFGLNRTSVGLKRLFLCNPRQEGASLNRTSVGLKLRQQKIITQTIMCLNRTSVGLKLLLSYSRYDYAYCEPQSNQRGIETTRRTSA